MALYGEARDISLFRHINRELLHDIISQQVVYYKYNLTETKVNIYGEATLGRVFEEPVLLYSLIRRSNQTSPIKDNLVGFEQLLVFKFLRDDLVSANLVVEVGDFIMWKNGYWEIDNVISNQYVVGKNPDYPYKDGTGENTLEAGLENFGSNLSIICEAHYVPADKVGIDKQRL